MVGSGRGWTFAKCEGPDLPRDGQGPRGKSRGETVHLFKTATTTTDDPIWAIGNIPLSHNGGLGL